MPYKTNGYQRKAQATIGGTGQSAVVVGSAAWGHQGGNDITVEFVNRDGADLPLSVEVDGKVVRVLLAKNATGALASTAAQVADAIEARSQGLIDRAHPSNGPSLRGRRAKQAVPGGGGIISGRPLGIA
jgi:hypothetical protein